MKIDWPWTEEQCMILIANWITTLFKIKEKASDD